MYKRQLRLFNIKPYILQNQNSFVFGSSIKSKPKINENPKYDEDPLKNDTKNTFKLLDTYKIDNNSIKTKNIFKNLHKYIGYQSKPSNDLKLIDLDKKIIDEEIEISILDNSWSEVKLNLQKLPIYYLKLAKRNLTALVVFTTMGGYAMASGPFVPLTFLSVSLGTALTSTAANAINQFLEVPYDSQMNRTKDRVLVRGLVTPLHAFTFASICAISGVSLLYYMVNPLTAMLGAANLLLYTSVYTPMKRLSVLNTWVGSIVGAIPPIMGFTACTGNIDAAALLFGAVLYSWQFPHFHALSWNLRNEYSRAGYRMMSVLNSNICTSSSFNHTVALTIMCSIFAPLVNLTTWNFAIDSLIPNVYFMYLAYKFKREQDGNSSRKLFRYSLIYLPIIMLLMLVTKEYPLNELQKKNEEILKLQKILNDISNKS